MIERRRLGNSDLFVHPIGLGCRKLANAKDPIGIVRRAIELGINFIDTAEVYVRSEEILGEALQGLRDRVVLATKGGVRVEKGTVVQDLRPESVRRSVRASLKRLRTDYIDLYQIHYPDPSVHPRETARALKEFLETGEIRYVGLSNMVPEDIIEWIPAVQPISLQVPLNLFQRSMYERVYRVCKNKGIGIIGYSPLLSGLLAGREPDTGERALFPDKAIQEAKKVMERLAETASKVGRTAVQLMLNWLYNRPGVDLVLVGVTKQSQLEEVVGSMGWEMDNETEAEMDALASSVGYRIDSERIPQKVLRVVQGYRGQVAQLELGIKIRVPAYVKPGDVIYVDWNGEFVGIVGEKTR